MTSGCHSLFSCKAIHLSTRHLHFKGWHHLRQKACLKFSLRITKQLSLARTSRGSSSPKPFTKQSHPDPVAWNHVQTNSQYLQEWRLHQLSRQSVLPHVQKKPLVFQFVPTSHHCLSKKLNSIMHLREMHKLKKKKKKEITTY